MTKIIMIHQIKISPSSILLAIYYHTCLATLHGKNAAVKNTGSLKLIFSVYRNSISSDNVFGGFKFNKNVWVNDSFVLQNELKKGMALLYYFNIMNV